MTVELRTLEDADLDQIFEWERDPRAVGMAAFTRADPSDRRAFDEHHLRVRDDPDATLLAVDADSALVGTIGSFTVAGEREVTYWIDPSRWGRGLAAAALSAFVRVETTRPLFVRVAEHNTRSAGALRRSGFALIGSQTSYADGVGREVVEHIYRLVHQPDEPPAASCRPASVRD